MGFLEFSGNFLEFKILRNSCEPDVGATDTRSSPLDAHGSGLQNDLGWVAVGARVRRWGTFGWWMFISNKGGWV